MKEIALKVYVTEADHAVLKHAAATENRSLSNYVAVAAVNAARLVIPPMLTPEREASIVAEHGADAVARYYEERTLRVRAAERAKGGAK